MKTPHHLLSAAAALEQILGEIHPEHDWLVTVEHSQERLPAVSAEPDNASAVSDESDRSEQGCAEAPVTRNSHETLNEAA